MTADTLREQDLQMAVANGVISTEQARDIMSIAHQRSGQLREDEEFQLFRGFGEIFISTGLVMLFVGIISAGLLFPGTPWSGLMPFATLALAWWFSSYFIRARQMVAPGIVLVLAIVWSLSLLGALLAEMLGTSTTAAILLVDSLLTGAVLALHYWQFRLPFTLAALGVSVLVAMLSLVSLLVPNAYDLPTDASIFLVFDLRQAPIISTTLLAFALMMLAGGLWCDSRDPHRVGTASRSAFWLHILAAPALVNTVALTTYNLGGVLGSLLTLVVVACIALLSLVIDRRSFLNTALIYLWILVYSTLDDTQSIGSPGILTLLLLGSLVIVMGSTWHRLRRQLMTRLPDFRGKARLPPYAPSSSRVTADSAPGDTAPPAP